MCEAFAACGMDVTLVRPFYFELAKIRPEQIFSFYGVEKNFTITTLPTLLSLSKPAPGQSSHRRIKIPGVGGATMLACTWFYLLGLLLRGRFASDTVIYSRNLNAAVIALRMRKLWLRGKPVHIFFEMHSFEQRPERFLQRVVMEVDGIVTITRALKNDIARKYRIDQDKIFSWPDSVREKRLAEPVPGKTVARKLLHIPAQYERIVLYTGQLLAGKGVDVLIRAAAEFDRHVLFLIVGGSQQDIHSLKKRTQADEMTNVQFAGFVPPWQVVHYQAAADVLVLPNTPDSAISDYTSPLKLFEYMAARRPIVASNLPVLKEVLNDGENAVLVRPADPQALAEGIRRLLDDEVLARSVSEKAFADVRHYTYENRARRIIEFISKNSQG